ncbi:hypothetical protein PCANC_17587 [Puccinia coronata f. sp. avenae]|uniref:Uncharacterized protein n=1 Tax=Puccinia coronata f. sp. avenae TaxID=200324 RepID=A0A2N5TSJ8_9BASI|nr:hypothetical protein PCASD_23305 [Puccinia coronata f. sp. avenae]PLW32135.1 hypothetical protein PCANC_24349 [Puccinia coronata f. sp. avenae]PLW51371.1 hypothetical protein PCANC_17587 [Puccinia coronata f. sp. avenae]
MLISGFLSGYKAKERMLEVTAISVSLASGHESANQVAVSGTNAPPKARRNVQINFDSDDDEPDNGPQPSAGSSAARGQVGPGAQDIACAPLTSVDPPPRKRGRPSTKKGTESVGNNLFNESSDVDTAHYPA